MTELYGRDRFFAQESAWGDLAEAPDIQWKVRVFLEMLPGDVTTLVDVGCGDGAITNELAERYEVTGVDASAAAVSHLRCAGVVARAESLPFPDRSFDVVMSSQMLEHLSDDGYRAAIGELRRVASRYVLISVPYREDLAFRTIRCPRCGWRGHVWGHRRVFTIDSLLRDLPDFTGLDIRVFGDVQEPSWPRWMLWPLHHIARAFYTPAGQTPICERCGNSDFSAQRGFLDVFYTVKRRWDRLRGRRPKPYWVAVLAERTAAASSTPAS